MNGFQACLKGSMRKSELGNISGSRTSQMIAETDSWVWDMMIMRKKVNLGPKGLGQVA